MGLEEMQRKVGPPRDGKLKARVWVVADDLYVAIFSSEEKARAYAQGLVGRAKTRVTVVEVDAETTGRFLLPVDDGGAD